MPTAMHFFNLQYWHLFLLILRMEHCWFLVQGLYWIFCCMERLKKPWGSQRHLDSRSLSELSSLEQPESLDSVRPSSMLTSTECRSRSSAPHDIAHTVHKRTLPLPLSSSRISHYLMVRGFRALHLHGWRLMANCAGGTALRGAQLPAT